MKRKLLAAFAAVLSVTIGLTACSQGTETPEKGSDAPVLSPSGIITMDSSSPSLRQW